MPSISGLEPRRRKPSRISRFGKWLSPFGREPNSVSKNFRENLMRTSHEGGGTRWQDVPELTKKKYASIPKVDLGLGNSHQAKLFFEQMRGQRHEEGGHHGAVSIVEKVHVVAQAKALQADLHQLAGQINGMQADLNSGRQYHPGVSKGFTSVSAGSARSRPGVWLSGSNPMYQKTSKPTSRFSFQLLGRIPIIKHFKIGGVIDDLASATINFVASPFRRGETNADLIRRELEPLQQEFAHKLESFNQLKDAAESFREEYNREFLAFVKKRKETAEPHAGAGHGGHH